MNFKHRRQQQEFPLAPPPNPPLPLPPARSHSPEVQVAWAEFYDTAGLAELLPVMKEIIRLAFYRGACVAAQICLEPPPGRSPHTPVTPDQLAVKRKQLKDLRLELEEFCEECAAAEKELRRA